MRAFAASSWVLFFLPAAMALDCATLTNGACRRSVECSLDCTPLDRNPNQCAGKYFCREKANDCERGFTQYEFMTRRTLPAACTAKAGCAYYPGSCYCPCDDDPVSACVCACGGGRPAQCVPVPGKS